MKEILADYFAYDSQKQIKWFLVKRKQKLVIFLQYHRN